MSVNRGKDFENVIRAAFEKVDGVSIDRLHDNTAGFKGVAGICDFIVYKKPYQYYIECKSVHGNTFPLSNITAGQWQGLLEKSKIEGVHAGILCWWVDKDVTAWLSIRFLNWWKSNAHKSVRYDNQFIGYFDSFFIIGKKKRVFFEYDMNEFLDKLQ